MPTYNGHMDYSSKRNKQNEDFIESGSKRPEIVETTEGATDTTKESSVEPLNFMR